VSVNSSKVISNGVSETEHWGWSMQYLMALLQNVGDGGAQRRALQSVASRSSWCRMQRKWSYRWIFTCSVGQYIARGSPAFVAGLLSKWVSRSNHAGIFKVAASWLHCKTIVDKVLKGVTLFVCLSNTSVQVFYILYYVLYWNCCL